MNRSRIVLTAVWLVGVTATTAVSVQAVRAVGASVTSRAVPPLSPGEVERALRQLATPSAAATGPPGTPAVTGAGTLAPTGAKVASRTVVLAGGTATVGCWGSTALLLFATPAVGYRQDVKSAGPARVELEFDGNGGEWKVTASCTSDVLSVHSEHRPES